MDRNPSAVAAVAGPSGRVLTWVTPLLMTATGAAIWATSLRSVELNDISDLGLVDAVPWWTVLGPLLLTVAFLWTLWRPIPSRVRTTLLAVETITIVVMLFGTGPILEPFTANHVAWRHVGISRAIQDHGIDGTVDAYFNWPGFFAMTAIAVETVGPLETVKAVAWAPVLLNWLYTIPVFFLAKWLLRSDTGAWMAAWIFLLGNWVGQDYFSPQGLAYFGYLVIILLLATSIADDGPAEEASAVIDHGGIAAITSKPIAVGMVVLIFGWIVVSHQLTPIAILLVVATLVMARRPIPWQLLTVMILMQVTWFGFLAVDYLRGNLQALVDQLGNVDQITQSSISNRVAGSAGHILVVRLRMLTVVVLATGGFLGWLHQRRGASEQRRRQLLTVALIGAAPFSLLALGAYGGEIALRSYLFALPVIAIFSASLLTIDPFTRTDRTPAQRGEPSIAIAAVSLALLLTLFPFTKYGNEDSMYFTMGEVNAIETFYQVAPSGSLVISATSNLPWKSHGYTAYEYRTLARISPLPAASDLADHIRNLAASHRSPEAYVLLTRSQRALNDSFGVWKVGTIERLADRLRDTPDFVVIYDAEDGTLFRYAR